MHLSLKEQLALCTDGAIFENVLIHLFICIIVVALLYVFLWRIPIQSKYRYSLGEGKVRRYIQLFYVLVCYGVFFVALHKQNDFLAKYIVPFSNQLGTLDIVNYKRECKDDFGTELPEEKLDDNGLCATIAACDQIAENINSAIASSSEYKRAQFDCYYSSLLPKEGFLEAYRDLFESEKNIKISDAGINMVEEIN
ncbi:MAG: hypothetical protein JXR76_08330, partial [Deltaproteobacteria bacterium]|nr:hypothetical protein [Deltaproteobacteria bacterium]